MFSGTYFSPSIQCTINTIDLKKWDKVDLRTKPKIECGPVLQFGKRLLIPIADFGSRPSTLEGGLFLY
ncbi:21_t:CDS:2 [Dentiscutata erythropus]|uniref:21_t:CDS:1 n=1 Tax=Dentiscutata erythropus TaxID=1348616 RepID=A0A9N9FI89_9GLOM|nr:21_t:CDS:2 [Dentiscutata erythropus]